MPFYKKQDNELLTAPNFVTGPGFELDAETHDQHTYPVDGWYWFNTLDEAMIALSNARGDGIINAVQAKLDAFAQSRGYDGILSACTYATSTVDQFRAEGQYCVDARDKTWTALYVILAAAEAGERPHPESITDIEAELPPLSWPA